MTDYRPINCEFHDVLESVATVRRRCRIEYVAEDGAPRIVDALIVDVFARDGVEYIALDSGELIRLDALTKVDGVAADAFDT
ncbi:MAG: hypothetical protein Q7T55_25080 [Solirubrobacteraceae bacterium]|nr:hypothetical protein [Solirubrobacteraceae bacterium]